ncbi:unnamed protein product [Brachionus calyciflorus]|uniref:Uncharacterized protein n=1 Tax=Brachionus calyciflorus TaxID=104777 RepID=A0A814B150_9BILA|nr:unnamed protein product [Brachionus calyciflorus]
MNVEIFKSNQQLELSFKFNKAIIEKVKTIKGAKFNGNQKLWSVPLESQDDLLSTFMSIDDLLEHQKLIMKL